MDTNALFEQAVRELDYEQKMHKTPGAPDQGSPVFSSVSQAPEDTAVPEQQGFGMPFVDSAISSAEGMYHGLAAGSAGLGESFGAGMQWLGNRLDNEIVAGAGEAVADYYKPLREAHAPAEELQGNVMDNPELLTRGDWWTYQVGNMAPSLGAAMLPGAAVGKAVQVGGKALQLTPKVLERAARIGQALGAGAGGGALEGTSTYREVIDAGGTEKEAARAGEFMVLASAGLNALSFGKMFSKAGQGVAAKTTKHLGSGAVEGASEWAEEPAESISKDLAYYVETGKMKPGVWKRVKQAAKEGVNVIGPAALTGVGGSVMSGPAGLSGDKDTSDQKFVEQIEQIKAGVTVDLLQGDGQTVERQDGMTSERQNEKERTAPDTRAPLQRMSEFYSQQEKVLGTEHPGFGMQQVIDSQFEPPSGMSDLKAGIQERFRYKPEPELEKRINREMAMRDGWSPAEFDGADSLYLSEEPQVPTPFDPVDLLLQERPQIVSGQQNVPAENDARYREKNFREASGMFGMVTPEVVAGDPGQVDLDQLWKMREGARQPVRGAKAVPVEQPVASAQDVMTSSRQSETQEDLFDVALRELAEESEGVEPSAPVVDSLEVPQGVVESGASSRPVAMTSQRQDKTDHDVDLFDSVVQELGHERVFNRDPEVALAHLSDEQLEEVGKKLGVHQGKKSKVGFIESLPGGISEKRKAYLSIVEGNESKASKRHDVKASEHQTDSDNFDNRSADDVNIDEEAKNVPGTASSLESDSSDSRAPYLLGELPVFGGSAESGSRDSGSGERDGQARGLKQSDNSLRSDDSSFGGGEGNNSVSEAERQDGSAQRATGNSGSGGSSGIDDSGEQADTGATAGASESTTRAAVNKYDGIAMNPPFGSGGKTAVDHLAKAFNHLREGGRVVCILPEGPAADRKFDKWYESKDAEHAHKVAEFGLPAATFGRAGTKVKTRVVIIDKLGKEAEGVRARGRADFNADTVEELFERIESVTAPERMDKKADPEASLKEAGLELKQASNSKGDFWVVTGETFQNKQALKEAGARWNRAEKGWAFYQEESPLQDIAEQLDRLPASLGDIVLEPVDRSSYDENSRRTTKETRLFEEQLRKEYGLDFPDGSVFAVRKNTDLLSPKDWAVEEGMVGADGVSGAGRDRGGVGHLLRVSDLHQEVGNRSVQKAARNGRGSKKQGLNESRMLDRIAGLFSKKIIYVASDLPILPAEAHADLKQKIIFMRPDANAPHLFLLGHEVIHLMKKESPALYDKLYDLVQIQSVEERWDDHYRRRDRLERMAGREGGLTRAQADEELIADFSGEQFMEPDFWEELAAEEPNQFRQVAKKIKKLIDRILSVFTRSNRDTRYFHDIELVRKGLVSVLAEYSRQQSATPSSRHDIKASKRDNGIHFSKTFNPRNHTSTRNVRGAVQGLQARAENALPLEVVSVFEDLPEHIRKAFKAQGGGYCEACNDPKTGKVWLVAENIASRRRAVELWLHEQGAHHGLRGLMGDKDYIALLGKVHRAAKREAGYKEVVADYGLDLSEKTDQNTAAHEYLAKLAEKVRLEEVLSSKEKSIWRKVVDAVLNWLTRIRVKLPGSLTRAELNRLVSDAVFWTVHGESAAEIKSGEAAPSYSRSNPNLKSAMSKIGSKGETKSPIAERFNHVRKDLLTEINQGLFDRFASLKRLDDKAEEKGFKEVGNIQESAYVAARMTTSHADQIAAVVEHGHPVWREGAMDVEGKGLAKVFEPVAGELDRFTGWLVGLRARKLMDEGRENLFTKEEVDELCKLNQGCESKYEDVRQNYIQFKTKVLDFAEAAGVVSESGRLLWENDEYIPFYRMNDETEQVKAPNGKKGIASQYSGIKRLQGGKANLGDPFENIIRNYSHLIDASNKNMAMEKAMKIAEKIGVAIPAEYKWRTQKLKGGALRSALVKTLGDDKAVAQLSAAQRDSLQSVFQLTKPDDKDVVHVLRDGKPVYFHIGDPLLLRSLTAVNLQALDVFGIKAARWFKRTLTTGVTSMPDFMVRNVVRDTIHAAVVDKTNTFLPGAGSVKGAFKTLRKDEDTVKMMAAGAAFHGGYSYGHDPGAAKLVVEKLVKKHKIDESTILDTTKKLAKFMKFSWGKWQELGSAFENATRAKIYEGVREKGGSHLEASFEAKDIMDYSMGGDWKAIRFLCETVPFLGARLVGLHRLGRGACENPKWFTAKAVTVAIASVLLYLHNRDREEFKELEQWDRDNYYHFFVGDRHYRMPKPFEVGAVFGTLPERLWEYGLDRDGDLLAERLKFLLSETLSFNPTPQIIRPMAELYMDKNMFTGRSIVPMRLQRLRPEAQRDHRTSETAAQLGEATGTSPKRIEHLVNGYFGTLGVYVLAASDMVTRDLVDAPEMPSRRLDDWPVLKSFYRSKPARHSRYLTELYDMVHEADELYSTVKAYAQSGYKDKAKGLLQDQENRKLLAKRQGLNQLRRAIGQIEKGIRQVHMSRTFTPDQKRERIDGLLEKRNAVVRKVMGD